MNVKQKIQSLINRCNRTAGTTKADLTEALKSLITKLGRYDDGTTIYVEYMDVAPYRSGETFTAPEKDGYLFAGWFTDEICSTNLGNTVLQGNAYAKFVPDCVLDTNVLISDNFLDDDLTNDDIGGLRFLSSTTDLYVSKVGFIISANGRQQTYETTKVYEGITGLDIKPYEKFCSISSYLIMFRLINMPAAALNSNIEVKAFWVTKDGTTVYGALVETTPNQAIRASSPAKIGDTYYPHINLAIAAAEDGDTITLVGDAKIKGDLVIDKAVTLATDGEPRSIVVMPPDPPEAAEPQTRAAAMRCVEQVDEDHAGLYVACGSGESIDWDITD